LHEERLIQQYIWILSLTNSRFNFNIWWTYRKFNLFN